MSSAATSPRAEAAIPTFDQVLGHPAPLWMLFMSEFWERFAFYGIRWALVLYIVAQFHGGVGQRTGRRQPDVRILPGAGLRRRDLRRLHRRQDHRLPAIDPDRRGVHGGGPVHDLAARSDASSSSASRRSSSATACSSRSSRRSSASSTPPGDERRDSGFTIFYMGINAGAFLAPLLTGWLAQSVFGTDAAPAYKYVFIAVGRRHAGQPRLVLRRPRTAARASARRRRTPPGMQRVVYVAIGALVAIPVVYFLLAARRASVCSTCSRVLFVGLAVMLMIEGIREGKVARDKVIAMMIIFTFNILFWMFFEQAGSSFTFLADKIVNRNLGGFVFPTAWFQSVNSVAIIVLAPVIAWVWVELAQERQSVDPAQVRPRPDLQRPRVPAADVRAVEPRRAPTARSRSGRWSRSTSSSRSASCASRRSASRW